MKSLFTTIILTSFIGIAVFGILGMHRGMKNNGTDCIAAVAQGMDCLKQSNPVDYIAFHIGAFKNFLTASLSDTTTSLLILSLIVIGIAFVGALHKNLATMEFAYHRLKRPYSFKPPQCERLRWLALHENSPSAPF
jgi:hypothetical protein